MAKYANSLRWRNTWHTRAPCKWEHVFYIYTLHTHLKLAGNNSNHLPCYVYGCYSPRWLVKHQNVSVGREKGQWIFISWRSRLKWIQLSLTSIIHRQPGEEGTPHLVKLYLTHGIRHKKARAGHKNPNQTNKQKHQQKNQLHPEHLRQQNYIPSMLTPG